jgi:hypothetical protein
MTSSNAQLPVELLLQILLSPDLSLADLTELSRVCHLWYQVIYPILYSTVYLSWNAPSFAARILDEHLVHHTASDGSSDSNNYRISSPVDGLRIVDHVRTLVLDTRMQRQRPVFHQLEYATIEAAFPLLNKLKKIDWGLPWLPANLQLFRTLSRYCVDIEHVSFEIPHSTGTTPYGGES